MRRVACRRVSHHLPAGGLLLLMALGGIPARADVGPITHSGRLLDGTDHPVTRAGVPMVFRLYASPVGGVAAWTSGSCAVSVVEGHYTVNLGADCGPAVGAGSWGVSGAYLEVSIDGIPLLPRLRLGAVPWADWAATALAVSPGAVGSSQLADGAVTGAKLAAGAVDASRLADGSVGGSKLAPGAVDASKLASDAASLGLVSGGLLSLPGGVLTTAGDVRARAFIGDGSQLTGVIPTSLSAAVLTSGTVDAARLPASVVRTDMANITLTGGVTAVGDVRARAFIGDGSQLTGVIPTSLSASILTSGTVDAARLPASVVRTDQGSVAFGGAVSAASLVSTGSVRVGADIGTCDATRGGSLRWTGSKLQVCTGAEWLDLSMGRLGGSSANPGASCKAIRDASASVGDGIYWIDPDGAGAISPYQTYCDMTTDGGGWTLVAYAGDRSSGFPRMDTDVGTFSPTSRSGKASKAAVAVVRISTETIFAYASATNYSGNLDGTSDTVAFNIPNPAVVDFGTSSNHGTCTAVTARRLKPVGSNKVIVGSWETNASVPAGVWSKSLGGTYNSVFGYGLFSPDYQCNSWPNVSHHWFVDNNSWSWEPSATKKFDGNLTGVDGSTSVWLR